MSESSEGDNVTSKQYLEVRKKEESDYEFRLKGEEKLKISCILLIFLVFYRILRPVLMLPEY